MQYNFISRIDWLISHNAATSIKASHAINLMMFCLKNILESFEMRWNKLFTFTISSTLQNQTMYIKDRKMMAFVEIISKDFLVNLKVKVNFDESLCIIYSFSFLETYKVVKWIKRKQKVNIVRYIECLSAHEIF